MSRFLGGSVVVEPQLYLAKPSWDIDPKGNDLEPHC